MKILQLCYEYPPVGGGGSRVVEGLSRELARRGHDVHVVTMGFRGWPRRKTVDGVTVHRVPGVRRNEYRCTVPEVAIHLLVARPCLRRLVQEHAFDINHTHFILPDGLLAARLWRTASLPYLITAHGSDVPGYNPHRLGLTHVLARPAWKRAAGGARIVVCPSRAIQALVRRRDPGLETTVIPYGFDPVRYGNGRARKKRILVVSRILRRKGIQHLLRAAEGLALDHEIHVVGDGPYLSALRRLARKNPNRIVFHGWLDNRSAELDRLYETSEIFVLPSTRENFPVSLTEAMAAGLAIITTRGTGCAEVVGDAALLVERENPAELRQALVALTSDPARVQELGREARARVRRDLSWGVVTDRYQALYERFRAPPADGRF